MAPLVMERRAEFLGDFKQKNPSFNARNQKQRNEFLTLWNSQFPDDPQESMQAFNDAVGYMKRKGKN
jgi:hypothetical protein